MTARNITMHRNKKLKSILYFFPSVILLGIFFIAPMLLTLTFSMTNMSLTGSAAQAIKFIGFRNFTNIIKDPTLKLSLINTLVFLVFSGIIGQQCLGFLLASLMKKKNKNIRRFVGFTILIGWITPEVIAAFVFTSFFADKGTLNNIIGTLGVSPISWLFTFPMVSVIIANIWKGSAYSMMMFQASLDNIPDSVVESAKIDGANGWQTLTRVTLPMIKNTLGTTFMIVTLHTIGAFGLIYIMTGGGPGNATSTLSIFMYKQAFSMYQLGYGTAIALIMLMLGITFSLIYMKLIKAND